MLGLTAGNCLEVILACPGWLKGILSKWYLFFGNGAVAVGREGQGAQMYTRTESIVSGRSRVYDDTVLSVI